MSPAFETALSLLAIGMITVFVVLALVVMVGKGIISFVNRFFPELQLQEAHESSPAKVAAITAAVDVYTKGKGKVTRIDRI